jgi:hypothetical protein
VAVAIAKTFPVSNDLCGRTIVWLVANQDEDQVVREARLHDQFEIVLFRTLHVGKTEYGFDIRWNQSALDPVVWL